MFFNPLFFTNNNFLFLHFLPFLYFAFLHSKQDIVALGSRYQEQQQGRCSEFSNALIKFPNATSGKTFGYIYIRSSG